MDENLHTACQYLLYHCDLPKAVHNIGFHLKKCFFGLETWFLLTRGRFLKTREEMLQILDDNNDKEVVCIARDWNKLTDDLTARPVYYIELLGRWARGMHSKLVSLEDSHET